MHMLYIILAMFKHCLCSILVYHQKNSNINTYTRQCCAATRYYSQIVPSLAPTAILSVGHSADGIGAALTNISLLLLEWAWPILKYLLLCRPKKGRVLRSFKKKNVFFDAAITKVSIIHYISSIFITNKP